MEYKIIYGLSVIQLERFVKTEIEVGWLPLGGVSIEINSLNNVKYYQTLIKKGTREL